MKKVLACIDGSDYTQSVSDYAVWAAERLQAPLEFLHVLQRRPQRSTGMDLSGSIGFEEQSSLLAELVKLDEQHAKLAQQRGRQILGGVVERMGTGCKKQPKEPRVSALWLTLRRRSGRLHA